MKPLSIILIFLLSGCGNFSRTIAGVKGYDSICVDGVSYLQFPSGVTVKYNYTGSIELCDK